MTTKTIVLSGDAGGGLKGIPLSALRAEHFFALTGGKKSPADYYTRVAWLRRAVDLRAETLASLPIEWSQGEEALEGQPAFPFELDLSALLNTFEAWLILYGAAYFLVERNVMGRPKNVKAIHPSTIKPTLTKEEGLTGFMRRVGGIERTFDADGLGYIWLPTRKGEIGPGETPVEAALAAAGVLDHVATYTKKFFEQGAIKTTVLSFPDMTDPNERERVENWFKRMTTGVSNAFRVLAVRSGLGSFVLGSDLSELMLAELTKAQREDIGTALGVPHSLLFSNAANFATAKEDNKHFYDKTVFPAAHRIERALNEQLFEPLGYTMRFATEQLELFQDDELDKAERLALMLDRQVITIDEARSQLDLPPLEAQPITIDAPPPIAIPANVGGVSEAVRAELRKWQRKAERRADEGKPDKAAEFESDIIPASLLAAVSGGLEGVGDRAAVRAVFADALAWGSYP